MLGFKKFARQIVADAELPSDVTPHVLRHSFISLAGDLGLSLPITGALVGHKGGGITARYTHLEATVLLTAADAVANETLSRLGDLARSVDIVQQQASGRTSMVEPGD
jgi:site-specific recombinase XerD